MEQVSSTVEGSQAFVLDTSGIVVAHSDMDQLGLNYLNNPGTLENTVARRILEEGQMQFDLKTYEGNFSVYADKLQGGWYSVSLISIMSLHSSILDIRYSPMARPPEEPACRVFPALIPMYTGMAYGAGRTARF